ncbi:MAG: peptidoglycan DD-metalloendopeptidase family protein [Candidatus Ratteibacteria bacterium]
MSNILKKINVILLFLLISGCSATIDTNPQKSKEPLKTSYHYVRQGENLFRIAEYYYGGKNTKEILNGVDKIKQANNMTTDSIFPGKRLTIPSAAKRQPNYSLLPPSAATISSPTSAALTPGKTGTTEYRPILTDRIFIWPINGKIICNYGELGNKGIDIQVNPGTEVLAADDGKIAIAGKTAKYPEAIIIEHSSTTCTLYAHDLDILVKKNDYVKKGTPIAKIKSGTHKTRYIHFEIWINEQAVNPTVYLP